MCKFLSQVIGDSVSQTVAFESFVEINKKSWFIRLGGVIMRRKVDIAAWSEVVVGDF